MYHRPDVPNWGAVLITCYGVMGLTDEMDVSLTDPVLSIHLQAIAQQLKLIKHRVQNPQRVTKPNKSVAGSTYAQIHPRIIMCTATP